MRVRGGPAFIDPDRYDVVGAAAGTPGARLGARAEMRMVLAVALGGTIGSVCRYAVSLAMPTVGGRFPWGTFVVNVSGSALLGALLVVLVARVPQRRAVRGFLGTGIIGGYTTFSTYAVESVQLFRAGNAGTAVAYTSISVCVGALACVVGMATARLLLGKGRLSTDATP